MGTLDLLELGIICHRFDLCRYLLNGLIHLHLSGVQLTCSPIIAVETTATPRILIWKPLDNT